MKRKLNPLESRLHNSSTPEAVRREAAIIKNRPLSGSILLLVAWLCLSGPHLDAAFYDHRVAARSGVGDLRSIQPEITINDSGAVAFIGVNQAGNNSVWLSTGPGVAATSISFSGSTRDFAFPQLNNAGLVAARDRVSGAPASYLVRTWNDAGGFTTLAYVYQGNPVLVPSISNDGHVSFLELTTTAPTLQSQIVLSKPSREPATPLVALPGSVPLRPVVGDGGVIAVRLGGATTDPIVLIKPDGTREEIASVTRGFTALGRSPGISDDGSIVVFAGDLSDAGARDWTLQNDVAAPVPLAPGLGIFASTKIGGTWRLIRIAGVGGPGGRIDPGERRTPGTTDVQGPDYNYDDREDWNIGGFNLDARVSISNKRPYSVAARGDYHTVVYYAANSVIGVSHPAVFSSRLNFIKYGNPVQLSAGVEAPILVIQASENVSGLGVITDVAVYDSANNVGEVATWATVGANAQAVVVSRRTTETLTAPAGPGSLSAAFINTINQRARLDPDSPVVDYVVTGVSANRVRRSFNYLVLHATVGNKRASLGALSVARDKSIHYLVTRDGQVIQIIPEDSVANHGANPGHPDAQNGNADSIGIELVDDCRPINNGMSCAPRTGHRDDPNWFTPLQEGKTALLVRDICRRRNIPAVVAEPLPALLYPNTQGDRFPHQAFNNGGNADFVEGNGEPLTRNDSAVTRTGSAVTINLVGNDVDDVVNGALAVQRIITAPRHGNVQINGGQVTYLPQANWPGGVDTFTYTAIDAQGGFSSAKSPGTVTLNVMANPQIVPADTSPALSAANREQQRRRIRIRDGFPHTYRGVITHGQILNRTATKDDASPVFLGIDRLRGLVSPNPLDLHRTPVELAGNPAGAHLNSPETNLIAVDDVLVTGRDTPGFINLLANDDLSFADVLNGTVAIVAQPAHGILQYSDEFPWLVTYLPQTGFAGEDEFSYRILFEEGDGTEPARVVVRVSDANELADVSVAQYAIPRNGSPTAPIDWLIEVRNHGPATASNVVVAMDLPAGYQLSESSVGRGAQSVQGNQIRIRFPWMDASQLDELTMVISRSREYGELSVSVASDTADPDPANRSLTVLGTPPVDEVSVRLLARRIADGTVEIEIFGPVAVRYHLEASNNLSDWEDVTQWVAAADSTRITAPGSNQTPFRFYRVRMEQ